MDSDCESVDSGLETGNSNLEPLENGSLEGDSDASSDSYEKQHESGSYDLKNSEIRWEKNPVFNDDEKLDREKKNFLL